MSAEGWIVFWWLAFAATHMLIAERRTNLIKRVGQPVYLLLYNGIAFATFIPLVWVYLENRHSGALLWASPSWLQHLAMLLAVLGIAVVPAAVWRSSPVGIIPRAPTATGLLRITRHPLFMGFGLWGFSHCLLNGFASDLLFFGGFVAFALIGCWHQDRRKLRDEGDRLAAFYAETSLLPFAAILAGRNRLVLRELPWLGLLVGLILAIGIYAAHPLLFR